MQNNSENILQSSESVVAMTHDSNCCEDFLQFRRSQVVKTFSPSQPLLGLSHNTCRMMTLKTAAKETKCMGAG